MPVQIRLGGEWKEPSACRVFSGGTWRNTVAIKVYSGAAWRTVANFTAPGSGDTPPDAGGGGGGSSGSLTLAATPTLLSSTDSTSIQTVGYFIATPSGGLAPYTYAWSIVSSDAGPIFTIDAPSSARTPITARSLDDDSTSNCTVQCAVTDSLGSTAISNTVRASFVRTFGGPLG